MATKAPKLADVWAVLVELRDSLKATSGEPDLQYWTRPEEPSPYPTIGVPKTTDPGEIRKRALHCVTWAGTTAHEGQAKDLAWAEAEKIKTLSATGAMEHKGGLYTAFWPDVACFLVLTGVIPLWARGTTQKQPHDAYKGIPINQVFAEIAGGNDDQGASG